MAGTFLQFGSLDGRKLQPTIRSSGGRPEFISLDIHLPSLIVSSRVRRYRGYKGGLKVWKVLGVSAVMLVIMTAILLLVEFLRGLPGIILDLILSWVYRRKMPAYDTSANPLTVRPQFVEPPYTSNLPYERKRYLLTMAEKTFFNLLSEAVPDDAYICPQVPYGAILNVVATGRRYTTFWNRIQAKRVDFLICDKRTLSPLVVVELDDSSHSLPKRVARDVFVEEACAAAGLPILRFRVGRYYDRQEIEHTVHVALGETRASGIAATDLPR